MTKATAPVPSSIVVNPKPLSQLSRAQKAMASRKRKYGLQATPEQIERVRLAVPGVSEEELLSDLPFYEGYVHMLERSVADAKWAVADLEACKMAAGFNRKSWNSLCKVGPSTPELLEEEVVNTLRRVEVSLEEHPGATVRIVLRRRLTTVSCGPEVIRERLTEGWRLCGFYLLKDENSIYAEVAGPCTGATGAAGAAQDVACEASGDGIHFRSPVLMPDGSYYDYHGDEKWEVFEILVWEFFGKLDG